MGCVRSGLAFVAVSAISFWETALLAARGRIVLLGATLVTADTQILGWGGEILRQDATA